MPLLLSKPAPLSAYTAQGLNHGPVSASIGFRGYCFCKKGYLLNINVLIDMKPLSQLWRSYQKHPWSITFYLLYILLLGRFLWVQLQFDAAIKLPHAQRLMWGEGIMYGYFLITTIAFLFIIITMANIIARKAQKRFYVWLLCLIIIPLVFLWTLPLL